MKNVTKFIFAIALISILSGCASMTKMPLQKDTATLDTSEKSVLLGKLKIRNENSPGNQPRLIAVFAKKDDKTLSFTTPTLIKEESKVGKDYFISFATEPGTLELSFARFQRAIPLLLNAIADLQLDYQVDVPANKVVYIGDITATIVKRQGDEPRAGSVIPLIDQSVAGFSNGTFKVEVVDNYESDLAELRQQFPFLRDVEVIKSILPTWVHPKEKEQAGK